MSGREGGAVTPGDGSVAPNGDGPVPTGGDGAVTPGAPGAERPHESAHLHVRGAAPFVDDLPEPRGLLHAALGATDLAAGSVEALDLEPVARAPGVVAVLSAGDVPDPGPDAEGEPLFVAGTVESVGQRLFAAVAATEGQAHRAVALARVRYAPGEAVLDVEEALAAGSLLEATVPLTRGRPEARIDAAPHSLEGTLRIGGQEHFYLEGQVALALPEEDGGMTVWSSTQHPSDVQRQVARTLGVADNRVTVLCRRLGGGFGGKETQAAPLACVAALAAARTGRPVRLRLRRDQDMTMTGKRHDFLVRYRVGFDPEGRILGLSLTLASRCGWSADLSSAVNTRALLHCDNAYCLPDLQVVSHRCRTHTVSNTAFRGFGAPQAMLAVENVLDDVARALDLDALDVRAANRYGPAPRDTTPYGMKVQPEALGRLMDQLETTSRYRERRRRIRELNEAGGVIRRGLALVPVKFGISFTQTHLNQAGALVQAYRDGTVLLSHGGTEMGQGLHTRVVPLVAEELGIDPSRVRITPTDTSRVPNTSPTAASASSDLNGMAARAAARTLRIRLAGLAAERLGVPADAVRFHDGRVSGGGRHLAFQDLTAAAIQARVSLSATGFYRTPGLRFDPDTMTGRPFRYFVYGGAACEVAVDTLTGEHRLLAVDILHDVGRSLNPAVDRGQIEGGFVQGLGWLTREELVWDGEGRLLTHGPSTYKIPTNSDWPARFRVDLLDWSTGGEAGVGGSRGIGEPPLMLAIAAFLAIKDAVGANAGGEQVTLHAPATPHAVLAALEGARTHAAGPVGD